MNEIQLSPSMMCAPAWTDISGIINDMESSGISWLHADVMDGSFVPNFMLGTDAIKQLRKISSIPLDIHLMIEKPEDKLDWFGIEPGEFVSVHAESTHHLQRVLAKIRSMGAKPMAALNPATPLAMIEDVLPDVDGVLIMTVNPGFAGQKLVPQTLDKISRLRKMLDEKGLAQVRIEVDGNVSFENAVKMRRAGADIFVCGTSSVFAKGATFAENTARLKAMLASEELQ